MVFCTAQTISDWLSLVNQRFFITFVYAKCSYTKRRGLWDKLESQQLNNLPWTVMGDFNAIHIDSKRVCGHPRPLISMLDFNECLDKCCLFDLHSSGRIMSWCDGHLGVNRSWAKLDRVVINNALSNQFMSPQ